VPIWSLVPQKDSSVLKMVSIHHSRQLVDDLKKAQWWLRVSAAGAMGVQLKDKGLYTIKQKNMGSGLSRATVASYDDGSCEEVHSVHFHIDDGDNGVFEQDGRLDVTMFKDKLRFKLYISRYYEHGDADVSEHSIRIEKDHEVIPYLIRLLEGK